MCMQYACEYYVSVRLCECLIYSSVSVSVSVRHHHSDASHTHTVRTHSIITITTVTLTCTFIHRCTGGMYVCIRARECVRMHVGLSFFDNHMEAQHYSI